MNIELPNKIYSVTDPVIKLLVDLIVSKEKVSRRLDFERINLFDGRDIEYTMQMLSTIHDRASSMVSHLSLMLALCMFTVQSDKLETRSPEFYILVTDSLIYIVLVLLSIRTLRSFGLDRDYQSEEEYIKDLNAELNFKYQIMEIVNSFTVFATVTLVIAIALTFYD